MIARTAVSRRQEGLRRQHRLPRCGRCRGLAPLVMRAMRHDQPADGPIASFVTSAMLHPSICGRLRPASATAHAPGVALGLGGASQQPAAPLPSFLHLRDSLRAASACLAGLVCSAALAAAPPPAAASIPLNVPPQDAEAQRVEALRQLVGELWLEAIMLAGGGGAQTCRPWLPSPPTLPLRTLPNAQPRSAATSRRPRAHVCAHPAPAAADGGGAGG